MMAKARILAVLVVLTTACGATAQTPPSATRAAAVEPAVTAPSAAPASGANWDAVVRPLRRVRPSPPQAAADDKRGGGRKTAQTAQSPGSAAKKAAPKGPGGGLTCAEGYSYDPKLLRCVKPGQAPSAPRAGQKKAKAPAKTETTKK